jgi:hypothetical protein
MGRVGGEKDCRAWTNASRDRDRQLTANQSEIHTGDRCRPWMEGGAPDRRKIASEGRRITHLVGFAGHPTFGENGPHGCHATKNGGTDSPKTEASPTLRGGKGMGRVIGLQREG